jgi:hypothetical protein
MVVAPPIAAVLIRGVKIDWEMLFTTLGLYSFALLVYGIAHVCRATWKTYQQQEDQIRGLGDDLKLRASEATKSDELRAELQVAQATIEERNSEIAALKQIPADIEIKILDLYHRIQTSTTDLFVKAGVGLKTPKSAAVRYKLDVMLFVGQTVAAELMEDIGVWRMRVKNSNTDHTGTTAKWIDYVIDPLKRELKTGDQKEGWLHFSAGRISENELAGCRIRLTALTPNGGSSDEVPVLRWPLIGRNETIVKDRGYGDKSQSFPVNNHSQ